VSLERTPHLPATYHAPSGLCDFITRYPQGVALGLNIAPFQGLGGDFGSPCKGGLENDEPCKGDIITWPLLCVLASLREAFFVLCLPRRLVLNPSRPTLTPWIRALCSFIIERKGPPPPFHLPSAAAPVSHRL